MRSTFAVTVIPVGHSITPTDRPIHKRTDTRRDSSLLDHGGPLKRGRNQFGNRQHHCKVNSINMVGL